MIAAALLHPSQTSFQFSCYVYGDFILRTNSYHRLPFPSSSTDFTSIPNADFIKGFVFSWYLHLRFYFMCCLHNEVIHYRFHFSFSLHHWLISVATSISDFITYVIVFILFSSSTADFTSVSPSSSEFCFSFAASQISFQLLLASTISLELLHTSQFWFWLFLPMQMSFSC